MDEVRRPAHQRHIWEHAHIRECRTHRLQALLQTTSKPRPSGGRKPARQLRHLRESICSTSGGMAQQPPGVQIETNMGVFTVELYWNHAPKSCRYAAAAPAAAVAAAAAAATAAVVITSQPFYTGWPLSTARAPATS